MKIKVRCKGYKRGEKYFTIGKVYEWEDGRLTCDDGDTYKNLVEGTDPKNWGLSQYYDFEVVQDQKIVITTDGKETLARLYEGEKVIKTATARCAPDDTSDFATGAKLAFERLMGEQKTPEKWRVVIREPKVGDYIRLKTKAFSFNEVGEILKVDIVKANNIVSVYGRNHKRDTSHSDLDWNYVLGGECEIVEPVEHEKVEKKFTPHLVSGTDHYGNIGEPTNYKDAIGRPLFVGDVVELFNAPCESHGDTVIVKRKLSYLNNEEKTFVMGIENGCNDKNGTTGEWKILKKRSFDEVENGEEVDIIKYVKGI